MDGFSKNSTTKGEAAPPDLKISEMILEIMEGIADRLQRLEAKVDMLATKADLQAILISANGNKVAANNPFANAAYNNNGGSYMDSTSTENSSDYSSYGGGNDQTISVRGIHPLLPVDYIKTELSIKFSSFGEITRVFVPADQFTGASLGYAYIDFKEPLAAEKALQFGHGYILGGSNLIVGRAEPIRDASVWPYAGRCGSRGLCSYC